MAVRQELDESFGAEEVEAIERIAEISANQVRRAQRDQHPKQHGCVWAEFKVLDNLPCELRKGIFAKSQTFHAWIRFSNASEQNDARGDILYGMAIKLMGVPGQKVLAGEKGADGKDAKTQDFVMATMPAFFVKNIQDYRDLLEKQEKFGVPLAFLWFVICGWNPFQWRWREGKILLSLMKHKFFEKAVSPLEEHYWSGTPYRLKQQSIKFFVKPDPGNFSGRKPGKTKHYLREAMVEHLAQRDAYFDFYVQLEDQKNTYYTPVDDPRIEWKEAKEYRVARIKIPCQKFDSLEQMEFGEHLSFTPWHCLPEHEPLGSINRARKESYQRTSELRHRLNGVPRCEPNRTTFLPHCLTPSLMQHKQVQQNLLTMIVKIEPGYRDQLEKLLEETYFSPEKARETSQVRSLLRKSKLTHFARFVILEDKLQGLEPHLLFSSNYDGDFENYVQELIAIMGYKLDVIFELCEGYNSKDALNTAQLVKFINQHTFHNPKPFFRSLCLNLLMRGRLFPYIANPGLSAEAIRNNLKIHRRLRSLLTRLNQPDLKNARQTLKELHDRLMQTEKPTVVKPDKFKRWKDCAGQYSNKIFNIWIGLKLDTAPNPAKLAELNELDRSRQEYLRKKYRKIQDLEDRITQNQLTVLTPIKPKELFYRVDSDWFHRTMAKIALTGVVVTAMENLPKLKTIHFARWVIVDLPVINPKTGKEEKKAFVLFDSNYDGAFDAYIDNFVKALGGGMDSIWGNCFEFPENGVQDIEWFKYYIRKYQFPAQVFYSAYPKTSIGQIQRDRDISQRASRWMTSSMSIMDI